MQDSKDNSSQITDHSSNEKLFELDKEFAEFFIQNLPNELEKLKIACEQKDFDEIKFQAHKMVPTLSMMSNEKATGLLKSLSKLENDADNFMQIAEAAILGVETAISELKTKEPV